MSSIDNPWDRSRFLKVESCFSDRWLSTYDLDFGLGDGDRDEILRELWLSQSSDLRVDA
jgi:hypothetical protein